MTFPRVLRRLGQAFWLGQQSRRFLSEMKSLAEREGAFDKSRPRVVLLDGALTWASWNMVAAATATGVAGREYAYVVAFASHFSRRRWHRLLLKSVSDEQLRVRCDASMRRKAAVIAREALRECHTTHDLWEMRVLNVWVGTEVLESHLRGGQADVDLQSSEILRITTGVVERLLFWTAYFSEHTVAGVVLSHDCYSEWGTIAKVAYSKSVPVYIPDHQRLVRARSPHSHYQQLFPRYREIFYALVPTAEREAALQLGREMLVRRLSGSYDPKIPSALSSSFELNGHTLRSTDPQTDVRVVIAAHSFYDNPHCYGGMLFPTFMDWLEFLAEESRKTNYQWFIKLHRNPLPGEQTVLEQFLSDKPWIEQIDADISWIELAEAGITHAITCYGTVGHELPNLGIQVISMGFNPHVAFSFCRTAHSLQDAARMISSLNGDRENVDGNEMALFYFMHYFAFALDGWFFGNVDELAIKSRGVEWSLDEASRFYYQTAPPGGLSGTIEAVQSLVQSDADILSRFGPVSLGPPATSRAMERRPSG